MRIALLSDIHANLPAFSSTFSAIDQLGVDKVYCLGDILGYGPFPNECISLVQERCDVVIKGNHDSGVIGETPLHWFNDHGLRSILWTQKHITGENFEYIKGLSLLTVQHDLTIVHASPLDPAAWTYVFTWREASDCFASFSTQLCFIGHTHIPIVVGEDSTINAFRRGCRFLINVGSVGQPRDGNPQACFGLLDTDAWSYELRRVEYDIQKTAQAIRDAGLPDFLAKRLFRGI